MHVILETERLILRRFTTDDVDNLVGLDGDPDVMFYINGGRITTREEIETDYLPAFLALLRAGRRRTDSGPWWRSRPATSSAGSTSPRRRTPLDEPELGYRLPEVGVGQGLRAPKARSR